MATEDDPPVSERSLLTRSQSADPPGPPTSDPQHTQHTRLGHAEGVKVVMGQNSSGRPA
jgi:hypothetical protein